MEYTEVRGYADAAQWVYGQGLASDGWTSESFFFDLLRSGFTEENVRRQMELAIEWGRYGELYEFNADTGQLKLERPPAVGS